MESGAAVQITPPGAFPSATPSLDEPISHVIGVCEEPIGSARSPVASASWMYTGSSAGVTESVTL